jgi:leucyl-tRNA synthetase
MQTQERMREDEPAGVVPTQETEIGYRPSEIEPKWQQRWEEQGLYRAVEDPTKQKWYALVMFPYTSGDLHIGHWYNFAPADTHARFMRMKGYNVLFPFGFDAFGLPAEEAAIRHGIHPFTWTNQNIERMRRQAKSIGGMYDWSREIATHLPEYYKWTQWFFLKFYEHGLAYRALAPANWCPHCQTTLANEQVINGTCERCHTPVTRKMLEQWFFRITKYAEELLADLETLQWPERIILMQRNWIGKSVGAEIIFTAESGDPIPVFTTRPDTLFGATFMVLAPEHPLVEKLTTPDRRAEVQAYIERAARETEIERLSTEKEKTGVFIGAYAINPANGRRIPIYIADYVLLTYGTGAIMAVPAHDERDWDFAKKYGIPIIEVIRPEGKGDEPLTEAYTGPGILVNSGQFDGMPSEEGKWAITDWLAAQGKGRRAVSYHMRDWLISRQRYWGAPIPIVYCKKKCTPDGIVPVPEDQLPVLLPEDAEFLPTGESPLKRHRGFVETTCPRCGGPAERETDTMDTFVDSSWYFLRYVSPHEQDRPFDPEKVRYWLPVDQYMGGAEHAVMHLLYARFFTKALADMGLIDFREPFIRLFNQGIILGEDGQKMSKSRPEYVVDPDEYVAKYGADTVRCFLMFIGPWELGGNWSSAGIVGVWRFLNRVWNLVTGQAEESAAAPQPVTQDELRRLTHKTIKRVSEDIERFRFNTMIAALMEYVNALYRVRSPEVEQTPAWQEAMDTLLLLLAPSAPHLAEELWHRRGHRESVHLQSWPTYDPALTVEETVTLVIQVNGRVRDRMEVPANLPEEEIRRLALERPRVQQFTGGKPPHNVIVVPGRLVNIVV